MFERTSTFVLAALGVVCVAVALAMLSAAEDGVVREAVSVGTKPATVYRPADGRRGPAIVIAHGFAGSQQLMQSFSFTLARNGYTAVTFDFAGHGRNPSPLTGDITREDGATETLIAETERILAYARPLGDGRLALLGHSMASDIIVRTAARHPEVAATIAVSMFSPAVTREIPKNLLVVVGDWEGMLKTEALRAVGLATSPEAAQERVTYGEFASGTARRAAFVPNTEHVSILFARETMQEMIDWLDAVFERPRVVTPEIAVRGPWIALLFLGIALLAHPATRLLPVVSPRPLGAGLVWQQLWLPLILPAIATPLILRFVPTHFLPVLVGDYLAVHFGLYGAITALCLWMRRAALPDAALQIPLSRALAAATAILVALYAVGLGWPLDRHFTSFVPSEGRLGLIGAMAIGTALYFLADEWLTRGEGAAKGAHFVSKVAFLASLALATALDFERLFFLMIIVPLIVLFFTFFGIVSRWVYRRTGHPWVAALANAVAIAWAIGVTFPLVAG
ncbi:MAG: alpha/beta fold hydrolase [Hyphomicrobium sp.]|nr:alpha/beta fold hydrolase [Hyphomicrobium sp.]